MDPNTQNNAPHANSDERIKKLLDRASEIGAPIPPFFLQWNNEEKIEKLNEIISNKEGEIASSTSQDENIQNSNELEAAFNPDELPSKIIIGLANKGIRIEVVDALMNLALYDEEENVLKVRYDADVEHVVGYVKSLGIIGEEAPESDLTDEEKDVDLKRSDSPDIDLSEVDTNELKEVVADNVSIDDGSMSTVDISGELKLPEEAKAPTPEETPVPVSPDQNAPVANIIGEQTASPTPTAAPSLVDNAPAPTAPVPPPPAPQDPNSAPAAAPAPAPSTAPASAPVEQVDANQNKPPKYLSEEESAKLADLRVRIAKLEVQKKSEEEGGETLESLHAQYEHEKEQCVNSIVSAIQDRWMDEGKTNLSREEQILFAKAVNDAVFQTLVVEEHDQYIKSIRENRKAGVFSRALEAARNIAGTKAVQWYVGQSRAKRWAINTAVMGTVVGVGALATSGSATIAGGLVALRTARSIAALAGGSLGSSAGKWAGMKATGMSKFKEDYEKKLQEDFDKEAEWIATDSSLTESEIDKKIKKLDEEYEKKKKDIWGGWLNEKEEEIKNAPGTFAEKTKKLQEVRDLALSKQRKVAGSKLIGSLVGGIGASLTTGAFADAVGARPGGAAPERMPKSRFEPNNSSGKGGAVESGGTKPNPAPESVTPKTNTVNDVKENYTDETGEYESMMRVTKAPEAVKSVFESPAQADFVPEKGSTLWGGMGKVLENNERFAKLPPEAKHFIQSTYLNKAIENPEEYNFDADPEYGIKVDIGKKINFAKLFGDKDEFEKLLTKAENLSDAQKLNIKTNDEAIANWVKAHPGEKATPEKIDEILNSKNNHATLEDDLIPKGDVPESSPHIEPGFEDETPAPEVTESYPDGGDTTPNLEQIESIKKSAAAMRDSFEKMNRDFESVKSQIDKSILESAAQKGGANPEIINSQIKATDALNVKAPQISGSRILEGLLRREDELDALFKETYDKLSKMIDEARQDPGSVDDSIMEDMSKTLRNITKERSAVHREIFNLMDKRPKVESAPDNFGNMAKGGAALTGATVVGKMFTDAQKSPAELQKEIEDAQRRYAELQNEGQADSKSKFGVIQGGRDLKTNLGAPRNMRSYSNDLEMMNEMRGALGDEINNIYTETNWLGRVKTPGVESADWGLIKRLPAYKVLDFRYKNSKESGLPEEVTKELSKNKRHQKMLKRLDEFMEYTGGTVRPRKEEPVETFEDFMLRLGMGIRKRHEEDSATNIKKAA